MLHLGTQMTAHNICMYIYMIIYISIGIYMIIYRCVLLTNKVYGLSVIAQPLYRKHNFFNSTLV